MRIGCEACACLSTCMDYAKQAFNVTVLACTKIMGDAEALQKSCILAHSILLGSNLYFHTNRLPKLIEILDTAQSFDFYGFCKLPRYLIHSYQAEKIDEYALLDRLEAVLCDKWDVGQTDKNGALRHPAIHHFAKEQLNAFLTQMIEDDVDFCTEDECRTSLKNWLSLALKENKEGYDPDIIDLSSLAIPIKKFSWLEILADISFIIVDIGCIPDFLQQWEIIDLSTLCNHFFSCRAFSWLPQTRIDDYVRSFMCVGFMLQFFEALRCLTQSDLNSEDKKNAKWILAVTSTEFLYNLTILQKRDIRLITFLAFIAKSIGVMAFLMKPDHSFFSDS